MLGFGPQADFKELVKNNAIIVDVRSKGEFSSGHIKGSMNIPLQNLQDNLKKLSKDRPIITCCASGMRSASAKNMLLSMGYKEVYNGGGWQSLNSKIH